MNDIAKNAASDKFLLALRKEHLSKKAAGDYIGITPAQVSYLFNKHYWSKLGDPGWDKVMKWVNSGQGLKEYSEKHGRVLPENKHFELPPRIISVKPAKASEVANEEIETLRKNLSNYKPDKTIKEKVEPEIKEKVNPESKTEPEPLTAPSFMESFIEALKQIPSNVTIQISINENNK